MSPVRTCRTSTTNDWTAAQAPLLFQPVCPNNAASCSGNVRQARNPLTGQILNNTYIDKLVPDSGNFYDGMIVAKQTVYDGKGLPARAAPRLRVGRARRRQDVGSRRVGHLLRPLSGRLHPVARRAAAAHGHADDELHDDRRPAELAADPEPARRSTAFAPFKAPTVYNWSIGVQQRPAVEPDRGRRLCRQRRPQSAGHEPDQRPAVRHAVAAAERRSRPTAVSRSRPNYLRPYRGYGAIGVRDWTGYNDYHSIQVSVNRRFSRRVRVRRRPTPA